MKKDLFLSTKRKIILTSTSVVFLSLIIFTIIVSTLYSSQIFDRIDMHFEHISKMMSEIRNLEN